MAMIEIGPSGRKRWEPAKTAPEARVVRVRGSNDVPFEDAWREGRSWYRAPKPEGRRKLDYQPTHWLAP